MHTQTEHSLHLAGFGSTSEPQLENERPTLVSIVGQIYRGRVLLAMEVDRALC